MIGENTALSEKPPTNQTTIRLIGGMAGWLIRSMYIFKILTVHNTRHGTMNEPILAGTISQLSEWKQ